MIDLPQQFWTFWWARDESIIRGYALELIAREILFYRGE